MEKFKTKRVTFEQFKSMASECPGMDINLTFSDYKEIIRMAKYFLKVQNTYIEEPNFDDPIRTISAFDSEKNEVRTLGIFANRPLNFIQWMKLQIADSCYCTKSEIKNFVEI